MSLWLFITLVTVGLSLVVVPPYLLWFSWWDKRMEEQAVELFPDADEERQRSSWLLLRALEGPRFRRVIKLDVSDFYARHHGKDPE